MQTCKTCLISQPLSEFHKGKGYSNGHIKVCKTCRAQKNVENREAMKAYNDAYRAKNAARIKAQRDRHYQEHSQEINQRSTTWWQAHPEKAKARTDRYYQANKEKMLTRSKDWYKANKEHATNRMANHYQEHADAYKKKATEWRLANRDRSLELQRNRYRENPEKQLKKQAELRAKNPEKERARHAKYAKENPDKRVVNEQRRRARKHASPINDLSAEQWDEILLAFNHRCAYCPDACKDCRNKTHELTQDHITPVAKGGSYTLSNIVPACRSCNARKHAGPVPSPVQPLLLTLAPPKQL